MDAVNHQFRLAARPDGMVGPEHFDYVEERLPELTDGQVLIKTAYISLDPAMRGWMREGRSYIPPVQIGEVMRAGGGWRGGRVQEPEASPSATHVVGLAGRAGVRRVLTRTGSSRSTPAQIPAATYLGALGMPGMTAYFGLLDVGAPKDGRDGRRLGRRRGRRQRRSGPDRQDQGLPRRRHRRWARQVRLDRRRARLRRGHRLQGRGRGRRGCASTARRASTCTSTTSAATSSTPALARPGARRAHRHLRRHLPVQQTRADAGARPTTCRCWSTARGWRASS